MISIGCHILESVTDAKWGFLDQMFWHYARE